MTGGYYLDFELKRDEIARYGLAIEDIQMIIESAIGGESITTTVEGRERYPVSVRYARELRDDPEKLKRVLIPTMNGAQVPLGQLAELRLTSGPAMIRDEDGQLAGYVFVDMAGRDIGSYVEEAKRKVAEQVQTPDRLYALMERPVRIHTTGEREADVCCAAYSADYICLALHQPASRRQSAASCSWRFLSP